MIPGDGAQTEDRARFLSSLYAGPQPSPELPVQVPAMLDGEIEVGRSWKMPRKGAALTEKPPEDKAVLTVSPCRPAADGSPRFDLRGTCACSPPVTFGRYGQPDLDLGANAVPGGPPPSRFLDRMGMWSHSKTELRDWLNEHRHGHSGNFELVVRDVTGYRIPWELLRLPVDRELGLAGGYLGALVPVTRWALLKPQRPEYLRPYDDPIPYQAAGQVVAYVSGEMDHDRSLLRDFDVDWADGVWHVFNKLAEDSPHAEAVAMVYIACHAKFSDDPDDCELDRFSLGRATRYDDDLPRLRKQATLVFLNGCQTGSVGVDVTKYNDGALRGFAILFLQSGAAGVLATTGAVGTEEAGVLAGDLLTQLRDDGSLSVAQGVRRLRVAAAAEIDRLLDAEPSEDSQRDLDARLLPFLYSFMYVYYGSPRLLMSIATRDAAAGTDEQEAGR